MKETELNPNNTWVPKVLIVIYLINMLLHSCCICIGLYHFISYKIDDISHIPCFYTSNKYIFCNFDYGI